MFDALDTGIDQRFDLLGRFGGPASQTTHFTGHHSEPAALLSGTRRLYRSIQRQNIGLERYAINDADDVRYFAR